MLDYYAQQYRYACHGMIVVVSTQLKRRRCSNYQGWCSKRKDKMFIMS